MRVWWILHGISQKTNNPRWLSFDLIFPFPDASDGVLRQGLFGYIFSLYIVRYTTLILGVRNFPFCDIPSFTSPPPPRPPHNGSYVSAWPRWQCPTIDGAFQCRCRPTKTWFFNTFTLLDFLGGEIVDMNSRDFDIMGFPREMIRSCAGRLSATAASTSELCGFLCNYKLIITKIGIPAI